MKSYLVSKHEDEQKNEAIPAEKMQEVIEKFKIKNDKVEDFKHLITFFVYKARVAVPYHSDTIKWCSDALKSVNKTLSFLEETSLSSYVEEGLESHMFEIGRMLRGMPTEGNTEYFGLTEIYHFRETGESLNPFDLTLDAAARNLKCIQEILKRAYQELLDSTPKKGTVNTLKQREDEFILAACSVFKDFIAEPKMPYDPGGQGDMKVNDLVHFIEKLWPYTGFSPVKSKVTQGEQRALVKKIRDLANKNQQFKNLFNITP